MSDLVIACGEDGRIEETNAALTTLVGRPEDTLRGQRLEDLLATPDDARRLQRMADWDTTRKTCRKPWS